MTQVVGSGGGCVCVYITCGEVAGRGVCDGTNTHITEFISPGIEEFQHDQFWKILTLEVMYGITASTTSVGRLRKRRVSVRKFNQPITQIRPGLTIGIEHAH